MPVAIEELFSRVDAVWREARGGQPMPRRADISPVKLGSVLQYVSLLDVVAADPLNFRYRLIGEYLSKSYGRNITGSLHTDHFEVAAERPFYDAYVRCAKTAAPQDMIANFKNANGTPHCAQARVWPLSDDGSTVTGLLGGCLYLEKAPC